MYTTKTDKKALVEGGCSDARGSTASPWIRTPLVPATLSDVESAEGEEEGEPWLQRLRPWPWGAGAAEEGAESAEWVEASRAYVDDPPAPTPAPTPASEAETTEGEVKPVV
jgi:hypothetical protein